MLSVAGITYDNYQKLYIGKKGKELDAYNLIKAQRRAIGAANKLKPIKLNPDKILRMAREKSTGRNPLGIAPKTKRSLKIAFKAFSSIIISGLMSVIVLDIIVSPNWSTIATVSLKLLPIVMSALKGYLMGYNNIIDDETNYINDQSDLITQCVQFIKKIPEKLPETVSGEIANTP